MYAGGRKRNGYTSAMEPVRYVDLLNQRYRQQGFPAYEWTVNDGAPLTTPVKPLAESTVAMLTSGGVSHCSMPAWNPDARNDFRLDAIDPATSAPDFQVHDSYYDTTDASNDINCVFPIDRLRELQDSGVIGAVATRHWSGFMGRIYSRTKVCEVSAPALAAELRKNEVDVFLLVPA
ncbi:MAG: glycine/sarcosine/betaine reductase selenoprotein B family protein [Ilumatobacteraceae bacterium]